MIDIQTDSRKIKKGDTFVAVKCEVNDGHKYINNAINAGATKVIAEYGEYGVETEIVSNTREYLNQYLKENYNKYLNDMTLIAYTGTNGKTTSSYLLYQALNRLGIKTGYIGTIGFYLDGKVESLPNTSVDICDTYDLLMRAYDNGYKTVIMEASSHALENGRLKTINFDYAIFTNLTQDHLDYHKTMENYALAKQKLFRMLKPSGKAIINNDDKYKDYFLLKENNNITYGLNENATYYINNLEMNNKGSKFTCNTKDEIFNIETKLMGRYNIYNLLTVISILKEMNFKTEEIINVVLNIEPPVGRMDKIEYGTNSIIIDYAHTPDGLENFISTVKEFAPNNIYIVFGCTGDRDRTKRPIMTEIVGKYAKKFIITNDDPHNEDPNNIVKDMLEKYESNNYEVCLDRKEAIIKGINYLKENDILLILGKGHEEVMIVKDKKIPFNDKKIVLEYIND